MMEVSADGIGVCLDADTFLCMRWNGALPTEQVARWSAFFGKLVLAPGMLDDLAGLEPSGASSEVISLDELRIGLALLTASQKG